MSLYNKLFKFINEYVDVYSEVNRTQNYKHPFGAFVRHDIVNSLTPIVDTNKYLIKGSCGAGRYTTVPWIAVFDRRITTSAQKGVYIVYLLNKDTKELYLTLNQGATDASQDASSSGGKLAFTGVAGTSSAKGLAKLRENAVAIRKVVGNIPFNTDNNIKCGSDNYDAGAICYKKYTLETLPDDKELESDLSRLIEAYDKYADWYLNKDIKRDFFKFLGHIDSLNGYQKSYKLVLYKVMFDLMDKDGKCYSVDVANKFRKFYVDRVNAGKVADIDVDKRIEFIQDSDIRDAYNVIITNPFKVISDKGFMYKTNESFELEQICFDDKLIAQLTDEDISKIKEIVDKKLDLYFSKIDSLNLENDWWPSLSEYNPEITKEKWLELLSNSAVFTESALKMMADFYVFGGTATCIQLAERYNKTYNYYLMTSVHLAERVVKTTGCPTVRDEKKAQNSKWWPVLYVGRDADKQEKGSFVWKIRDELYDALTEFGIERYFEDNTNTGGEKMTTKQKIEAIKNYIASEGFNYEGNLIENFYLSLKSKPFVILAGTSGTGKTRLVKLFAKAIGAKMKLVPVRPDWSDSSDLFGHTDLSGKFQPGAIIDFIKQAEWDSDTPYFLCLDEMNLARVEYYLSDFLSVIETRDRKENGDIETEPLVDVDYYKDKDAMAKYGRVFIPDNLYIIGTVNMDETTFPFSKKVLDRANTIEFSYVNLMAKAKVETVDIPRPLKETNSFLKTEYLYLKDCADADVVDSVCFDLNELNSILVKANLHVGYRVRDEISFYMMNNKNADLLSKEAAFDNEIMQKILPRIQGSSRAIKDVLSELFVKCAGDYTGLAGATDFEQMLAYTDSDKNCKYPNSAKKIAFMMRRYEEDGFTSYWL